MDIIGIILTLLTMLYKPSPKHLLYNNPKNLHFLVTAILALAKSKGYVQVDAVTPAREPAMNRRAEAR